MNSEQQRIEIMAKIFENEQKKGDPRYNPHVISEEERKLIKPKNKNQ